MSKYVLFRVAQEVLGGFVSKSYRKQTLILNKRSFHVERKMVRYITQSEAVAIDKELFTTYKFSLEQLMELAGLACACAIYKCYCTNRYLTTIVLCGPGNNGGDGLVCARHLKLFGFKPEIYYPKPNQSQHFKNLVEQCYAMDIHFHDKMPILDNYDMAVDALFGFSFKPPIRSDFVPIMTQIYKTNTTVCSIDIPSGWDVDKGCPSVGFMPDLLISLTAPKKGVLKFEGKYHFLGGRFVPNKLALKYHLKLPTFLNTECCIDITGWEDAPPGPLFK